MKEQKWFIFNKILCLIHSVAITEETFHKLYPVENIFYVLRLRCCPMTLLVDFQRCMRELLKTFQIFFLITGCANNAYFFYSALQPLFCNNLNNRLIHPIHIDERQHRFLYCRGGG